MKLYIFSVFNKLTVENMEKRSWAIMPFLLTYTRCNSCIWQQYLQFLFLVCWLLVVATNQIPVLYQNLSKTSAMHSSIIYMPRGHDDLLLQAVFWKGQGHVLCHLANLCQHMTEQTKFHMWKLCTVWAR